MPEVTQRLQDDDCDTRTAALTFLSNMLCLADRQRAVPIALQLVKTLLPLFESVRRWESRGLVSMPGGAHVHGPGVVPPSPCMPTGP